MRVLLTGAGGQLGRELQRLCPPATELLGLGHSELDITDEAVVAARCDELRPEAIVNAAAYTSVDRAEAEPEVALAVNARGVGYLVAAAARHDSRLIHISSDFVFSGEASRPYAVSAAPDPGSVYGRSKLRGEQEVLIATGRPGLVIRTAWLYSNFGHNFVKTMLQLLRERDEITVVADQIGSPTWARGLAAAIWRALDLPDLAGLHHWTDAGVASWYDLAVAIQDEAGAIGLLEPRCRVRPVSTADYPRAAQRPAYSVLDISQTAGALGLEPVHWRHQLRLMLQGERGHGG